MTDNDIKKILSPELMRRELRFALRRQREAAGLTQKDVAEALYWSVSKVIRMEQGDVAVSPSDAQVLMHTYGVTDEARIAQLAELAHGARQQSAWTQYRDVYSEPARTLFANEPFASTIYKHEPSLVPGMFQTEEYTRGLLERLDLPAERIDRLVEVRLARQELLTSERRPDLQFVMGEAVVSRPIGGVGVMKMQLKRLVELAESPGISLHLLPFSVGAHPRIGDAFTILEFPGDVDSLLYRENAGGETTTREDARLIGDYLRDWITLQGLASAPKKFAETLEKLTAHRF